MRIEYIKPFVDVSKNVLSEYIKDEMKFGEPSLVGCDVTISGVASIVSFWGDLSGVFLLYMDDDVACGLVSLMLMEEISSFNSLAFSAIQELSNLIVAQSSTDFYKKGYTLYMMPPIAIRGDNMNFADIKSEALYFRINTSLGCVNILIAIDTEKEYF